MELSHIYLFTMSYKKHKDIIYVLTTLSIIKLFCNTHNQKKSSTKDKKIREKYERDFVWGIYHKNNSDN